MLYKSTFFSILKLSYEFLIRPQCSAFLIFHFFFLIPSTWFLLYAHEIKFSNNSRIMKPCVETEKNYESNSRRMAEYFEYKIFHILSLPRGFYWEHASRTMSKMIINYFSHLWAAKEEKNMKKWILIRVYPLKCAMMSWKKFFIRWTCVSELWKIIGVEIPWNLIYLVYFANLY